MYGQWGRKSVFTSHPQRSFALVPSPHLQPALVLLLPAQQMSSPAKPTQHPAHKEKDETRVEWYITGRKMTTLARAALPYCSLISAETMTLISQGQRVWIVSVQHIEWLLLYWINLNEKQLVLKWQCNQIWSCHPSMYFLIFPHHTCNTQVKKGRSSKLHFLCSSLKKGLKQKSLFNQKREYIFA